MSNREQSRAATPQTGHLDVKPAGLPRGTIKSFREYLNEKFAKTEKHSNGRYQQKKRLYGDYLYGQDREQFMVELNYAIAGNDHKDWKRP